MVQQCGICYSESAEEWFMYSSCVVLQYWMDLESLNLRACFSPWTNPPSYCIIHVFMHLFAWSSCIHSISDFCQNLLSVSCFLVSAAMYTHTNWQSTVNVREYRTYSSGSLLEYKVPINTARSYWVFTAYKSPDKCEERTLVMWVVILLCELTRIGWSSLLYQWRLYLW